MLIIFSFFCSTFLIILSRTAHDNTSTAATTLFGRVDDDNVSTFEMLVSSFKHIHLKWFLWAHLNLVPKRSLFLSAITWGWPQCCPLRIRTPESNLHICFCSYAFRTLRTHSVLSDYVSNFTLKYISIHSRALHRLLCVTCCKSIGMLFAQ